MNFAFCINGEGMARNWCFYDRFFVFVQIFQQPKLPLATNPQNPIIWYLVIHPYLCLWRSFWINIIVYYHLTDSKIPKNRKIDERSYGTRFLMTIKTEYSKMIFINETSQFSCLFCRLGERLILMKKESGSTILLWWFTANQQMRIKSQHIPKSLNKYFGWCFW